MRRSRLVERATTDEDDELDSWGSDDDDEDEKAEVVDQSEVKEETKSLRNEDIGPDGSPENESQKEQEQPVDTKGKIVTFCESSNYFQFFKAAEEKVEEVSIPSEMKNSTTSSKTEEKSESKESDWTNVEKSESDDWEADFSDDEDINTDAKKPIKVILLL